MPTSPSAIREHDEDVEDFRAGHFRSVARGLQLMLLLVDLDGVVYRGRDAVPGVAEVLQRRAAAGDRIVYVTNNSRSHRDEYVATAQGMGVPLGRTGEESIVTAARATAVLLAESDPPPRLAMVLGGPGLARELRDVGIRVVAPTERGLAAAPDTLVVGVDFSLTYLRLSIAARPCGAAPASGPRTGTRCSRRKTD